MANVIGSLKVLLGLDAAEFTAGLSKADAQAAKFADKQARNSAGIDRTVASLQRQADQFGKTTREIKLMELAQRGATAEQLRAADGALRASERYRAVERAAGLARVAAAAVGVAAVAGIASLLDSQTRALDAFNDLSDATGASVETISALDQVARRTGGTFETVEGVLVKFNQALGAAATPGSDAARTLEALGLSVTQLSALDPAEALRQTAVALAQFADDGDKARAIQELFGKSVREAAPLLKDLAEQTRLVGVTTAAQAEAAERYQRSLSELKASAEDLGRSLVSSLVPRINETVQAFKDGAARGESFFGTLRRLQLEALGFKVLPTAEEDAQQIGRLQKLLEGTNVTQERRVRLERQLADIRARGAKAATFEEGFTATTPKPTLNVPGKAAASAATSQAAKVNEAQRYLETLQRQVGRTQELGVAEQALADIQSGRLGRITPAMQQQILMTAQQIDGIKAATAAEDEAVKSAEAREEITRRQRLALQEETESIEQDNAALRDEIAILRGGEEARRAIEAATLSSAIAVREDEAARLGALGVAGDEVAALEAQIALLRERQGLLGQREDAEETKRQIEDTKGLVDDLGRSFADAFGGAASGAGSLRDVLQGLGQDLLRITTRQLVTKPLGVIFTKGIQGALGGTGGDFGSLIGSLFGGGASTQFPAGFANGGRVGAGIFEVAESRPEVLDVGGRKFLLSKQGGTIDPAPQLSGKSRTVVNAPINISMPANTSAQTANQAGAAIARRILAVNRRYN